MQECKEFNEDYVREEIANPGPRFYLGKEPPVYNAKQLIVVRSALIEFYKKNGGDGKTFSTTQCPDNILEMVPASKEENVPGGKNEGKEAIAFIYSLAYGNALIIVWVERSGTEILAGPVLSLFGNRPAKKLIEESEL